MPADIKRVAVIGSGVMGSQIAAHITNAGVPVLLLDIVPKDAADRNVLAKTALEKLQKAEPSTFMHPDNAKLITVGNLDDDVNKLRDMDWIVEAVLENLQIKSDLYKKIDAVRKPGSIVSSNTSTIPLARLIEGQSPAFIQDFLITHFFNPLRYMRLLELVTGPQTKPDVIEIMRDFCDRKLGKGVIPCNDTPGFIANRLGMFWLQSAVNAAMDLGLTVEEADEVCGKPMGIPRTGVFGLLDLIGIDLMPLIGKSLVSTLPPNDPYRVMYREPPLFTKMIAEGYTGRKGRGGFFRFSKTDAGKVKESVNLQTGEYAPSTDAKSPTVANAGKNLRALCEADDKIGKFAWRVLSETLSYAFMLVPSTVSDITGVDDAMRMGYNWQFGPFELIDKIGAGWMMQRLLRENRPVPELLRVASDKTFYRVEGGRLHFLTLQGSYVPVKRPVGVLLLSDVKLASKPMLTNASANLWDIGDGVLCLEFTSKANAIDDDILNMLDKTIELIGDGRGPFKGLVIHNEGPNFSVGANIGFFMECIKNNKFDAIEKIIRHGQSAYGALRFAPFPSVAAPMGMALGGGCEIALHCSAVQAYTEFQAGLVEANVGLIPGWGGCAQMLCRAFDAQKRGSAAPPISQAFSTISAAAISKTAAHAFDLHYLRPTDAVTINKDRLLFDAKKKALDLAKDYRPPEPCRFSLPGTSGRSALDLLIETARSSGKPSPHDVAIWNALAAVLCGGDGGSGPLPEKQLMDLECREFMRLIRPPESAARIEAMLNTGKPLKN